MFAGAGLDGSVRIGLSKQGADGDDHAVFEL
jgi:hypothetical protein